MALEGCETVNAAKTVSGQYAPVQEWQIGYRPVVFLAVGIKTGLFQQRFDKSMFKTIWYNTR